MTTTTIYTSDIWAENVDKYRPGGYHPIHLGDRLKDGRYEILHKLADGQITLVWLAIDHAENRNVAIKIYMSSRSTEANNELAMLRYLKNKCVDHPGYKHVIRLLDDFHLDGPNGRHICLVTHVLGPDAGGRYFGWSRKTGQLGKTVSKQLLLAVDYLHAARVVHGDISACNVVYRLSPVDLMRPDAITNLLGNPVLRTVTRFGGGECGPEAPKYTVVAPWYLNDHVLESLNEVKEVVLTDLKSGTESQTIPLPSDLVYYDF